MIARRSERTRHAAALGVAAALAFGLVPRGGHEARAQGHTPDPFNLVGEYNLQYAPYIYPVYPNSESFVPNQDRLGVDRGPVNRGASRFQSSLDDGLDEFDEPGSGRGTGPRPSGAGVPYYRANRFYDQQFQRTYRPNEVADRSFYSDRQQRDDKYFQAIREKDLRKRAQLLREYNLENLRASRHLSTARGAAGRDRDALHADEPAPPPLDLPMIRPLPRRPSATGARAAGADGGLPANDRTSPRSRAGTLPGTGLPRPSALSGGSTDLPRRFGTGLGGTGVGGPPSSRGSRSGVLDRAYRPFGPALPNLTTPPLEPPASR